MTDWKQQIEAQITEMHYSRQTLKEEIGDGADTWADTMQTLLDVAVAAEDYRKAIRNKHRFQRIDKMGIKVDEALDKL